MTKVLSSIIILSMLLLSSCSKGDDKEEVMTGSGDATSITREVKTDSNISRKATFSISSSGSCRIPQKGHTFGKSFKVVFSDGYSVIVANTFRRCALRNGFIYRDGGGSYRNVETWTSHGGAFISRPKGNKSNTLTIYW